MMNFKIGQIPYKLFSACSRLRIFRLMSDERFLKFKYRGTIGRKLNLDNPKSFNEKLQWLKLYDRKPIYTTMVDKYEAKKYVASIIGDEYIIPTLGVWDHFDDIDFDILPEQFVLKCTHDSGGLVIVKDKSRLDRRSARRKIEKSLKYNYFWQGREWPYKNVKPRIIAEKYMTDETGVELKDYKVFNFDGQPELIQVDYGRFVEHKRNLYSTDWEYIEAAIKYPTDSSVSIKRPESLEKMLDLARKLSEDIPHVRTDFYSIEDKIYFGEMTFYHESGFGKFKPEQFGVEVGNWLKLPDGGVLIRSNGYILYLRSSSFGLIDFKVHSFNGVPKVILVCRDRFMELGLTEDFFDCKWQHLPLSRPNHSNASDSIGKPPELDKMIQLAEKLSKDIPFLRTDFYIVNGEIYVGELTFYPTSGFETFVPERYDDIFGDWIKIPSRGGIS